VDIPTVVICVATVGVLSYWKRVPEPVVVVIAGIVGFFLYPHVAH
jgi:hypothetical protein